jgi:hypothetical protein
MKTEYKDLVGSELRNPQYILLGIITKIEEEVSGYWKTQHTFATLDNGEKVRIDGLIK